MGNNDISVNNKRIVRNTIMLYVRMFVIIPISFIITRKLLAVLGFEDFGLANVIGGIVSAFSFISGMISSSVSRYYNFEIAGRDIRSFTKTFNTSLQIFLCAAIIILFLSETVGLYIFWEKTAIAPEKFVSAFLFFQFTVFTFIINIFAIPYYSLVISHEDMGYFSAVSIMEVFGKLASVYILHINLFKDKLASYGLLLLLIALAHFSAYFLYCRRKYPETGFDFHFYKGKFFELVVFSGWNLWGASANLFSNVFINILLNNYFGPVVNAARTVSMQVSTGITSFSTNFMTAARPQIVKYWAAGNAYESHLLVSRSARFAFYMIFIFAMPVFLEAEDILNIWLVDVPPFSVSFTRLVIVQNLIDVLSVPLITLILATGRVAVYQAVVGITIWMNFPLSYLAIYYFDLRPSVVFYISISIALLCMFLRFSFVKYLSGMTMAFFVKNALGGCVKVFFAASFLSLSVKQLLGGCVVWYCVLPIYFAIAAISILLFGVDCEERGMIKKYLGRYIRFLPCRHKGGA